MTDSRAKGREYFTGPTRKKVLKEGWKMSNRGTSYKETSTGHSFTKEEKESSSLSKNADKCRRNNRVRTSLEKHHHSTY